MAQYIGALDLGTTSNRFIVFDHQGRIIGFDQMEHEQILLQPGWVEHDPMEIWRNSQAVIKGALGKTGISGNDLAAIRTRHSNLRSRASGAFRATSPGVVAVLMITVLSSRPYCPAGTGIRSSTPFKIWSVVVSSASAS